MECRHVQFQQAAYLDGDLSARARDAIALHLADCDACRHAYGEARDFDHLLRGALAYTGPVYRFAALRARLAELTPLDEVLEFLPRLRVSGRAPRFVMAVVLLLIALAVQLPASAARRAAQTGDALSQHKDRIELAYAKMGLRVRPTEKSDHRQV